MAQQHYLALGPGFILLQVPYDVMYFQHHTKQNIGILFSWKLHFKDEVMKETIIIIFSKSNKMIAIIFWYTCIVLLYSPQAYVGFHQTGTEKAAFKHQHLMKIARDR